MVNESRVQGVGQIICRDTKDVENDGQNIGGDRERDSVDTKVPRSSTGD